MTTGKPEFKHSMQGLMESWEDIPGQGDGEGRAIVVQATKSMLPGKVDPGAHLRMMARMPADLTPFIAVLSSHGIRTAALHRPVAVDAPDMYAMDEGERLVTLISQASIGQDGQSRLELKEVISSIAKFATRMMRRAMGRGGGEETMTEGGL